MIGVIGSGSWATAIAKILSENCNTINWWIREPQIIEGIQMSSHNPLYLSQVAFNREKLNLSNSIAEVIRQTDDIVLVVPAAFVDASLQGVTPEMLKGKRIHSAVKGIIPETNQIVAHYLEDKFNIPTKNISIVSGPSHAEEIAQEKLTFLTVASENKQLAENVSEMFNNRYVRTVLSEDIYGIEYGAVLKNIYALATGIYKGLGYGDNFIAVLISNAMREMDDFIQTKHPMDSRQLENFAYLGDLLVTAYSQHSRNRTFGTMIGSGYSVKSAMLEMKMVAEGYYATKCIYRMCKEKNISMPIVEAVYNVLYESASPAVQMRLLSERLI